jgi:hypothetical protein
VSCGLPDQARLAARAPAPQVAEAVALWITSALLVHVLDQLRESCCLMAMALHRLQSQPRLENGEPSGMKDGLH